MKAMAEGHPTARAVRAVREAIEASGRCRLPDLLRRERVVVVPEGRTSHGGAPELVALLAIRGGYWYGHVLRLDPEALTPEGRAQGPWASLIVQAFSDVDGHTPEEVVEKLHRALVERLNYQPAHALGPDELFRLSPTFEAACLALAEMAEAFDPLLALGPVSPLEAERPEHPRAHEAKLDMRVFDVYGLDCCRLEADEDNPWAPGGVFYEAARSAELRAGANGRDGEDG